ncbi:MAG: hypothetical protein ACOX3E_10615 [Desulfomonilia bacterium]
METSKTLEEAGYIHYEVSNFAAGMGRASRHNRKYWDHTPYLGLGPAAHSFEGTRRWWNRSSLKGYLTDLSNRKRPVEGQEDLRSEELAMEALFLGLRTREGIDLDRYVPALRPGPDAGERAADRGVEPPGPGRNRGRTYPPHPLGHGRGRRPLP